MKKDTPFFLFFLKFLFYLAEDFKNIVSTEYYSLFKMQDHPLLLVLPDVMPFD